MGKVMWNVNNISSYLSDIGMKYISGEYSNRYSMIKIKCSCGNTFEYKWQSFVVLKHKGCQECSSKAMREERAKGFITWDFKTLDEYIKLNHPEITLLNLEKAQNKRRKMHITITNGIRTKTMELVNFINRGCVFYEKTDKGITIDYVKKYLKDLDIDMTNTEIIKVEHTEDDWNTYIHFKYKDFNIRQHWGSVIASKKIAPLDFFKYKENLYKQRYNLVLLDYNKDERRYKLFDEYNNIEKWVSEGCLKSGQFTMLPIEEKTNRKIEQFMLEKYKGCEILNIVRRPCTNNGAFKNYIFIEFEHKGEIYDIEYGRLKKGFNFYSNTPLGEKIMKQILEQNNVKYEWQKKFDDLKNVFHLKYDFYLSDYNAIIEIHGIQHYEPVENFGGMEAFLKNKYRDEIKLQYAKDNDIKMFIVDRSSEFSANSINSFIKQCKITLKSIVGEIDEQRPISLC
jgi:hypothetical protein